MSITNRAKNISPSLTLAITAKAKKLQSEGKSVISFGAGEPDFNTPDYIIAAAKTALDQGFTKYTPSSGMPKLRQVICDKLKKDNGLDYKPSQIIVSSGAKHSLYNAVLALVQKGDQVIIPSPYWLTYPELVNMCDGECVFVKGDKNNSYKVSAQDIRAAVTSKTKMLILNSPCNPTGAVYTKEELEEIAKLAVEKDFFVLSDEIYEKLIYDNQQHYSIASFGEEIKNRTIIVNGVSKTYSMTGWRIGYLAAPQYIADAIDSVQSHATSNACSISQAATVAAMSGGEDFIKNMQITFDERRKYIVERINTMDSLSCSQPKGAFYVMMDISKVFGKKYNGNKITSALSFCDYLLEKGVAAVPGEAFDAPDCVRLSYAISLDDIKVGLDRIEEFTKELV